MGSKYTKLLLHLNNELFLDEVGNKVMPNNVILDTANKKFGYGSDRFQTGSGIQIPEIANFGFTNDFTIDFWFYLYGTNTINCPISKHVSNKYDSFYVRADSNNFNFLATTNGSTWDINLKNTSTIINNKWY